MGGNAGSSKDALYSTQKDLMVLAPAMKKKEEGRAKYFELVYNKMKPKWLYSEVASHPLSNYWIVWIDQNIN
jgi:hypothetical protein